MHFIVFTFITISGLTHRHWLRLSLTGAIAIAIAITLSRRFRCSQTASHRVLKLLNLCGQRLEFIALGQRSQALLYGLHCCMKLTVNSGLCGRRGLGLVCLVCLVWPV